MVYKSTVLFRETFLGVGLGRSIGGYPTRLYMKIVYVYVYMDLPHYIQYYRWTAVGPRPVDLALKKIVGVTNLA